MGIETLTAWEAIQIAISGLVIVTLILGCLAILITLISKVVIIIEGTKQGAEVCPVEPAVVAEAPAPLAYGGETLLIDVDEKTAACIMAIVSENTGIPLSQLIFKKIRAL